MLGRYLYDSRVGETYLFVDAMEWRAHYRHEKRHERFELVSLTRAERILREVACEDRRLLQQLFEDFTYSRLTRLEPRQQLERLLRGLGYEPVLGEPYPRAAKFYVLCKPFSQWPASGFPPLPAMPADMPFDPQVELSFIDFALVDRFGNPKPRVAFTFTDAAGTPHQGSFRGDAKVHLEPVEPGAGTIDLPELNPGDWKLRGAPPDGYPQRDLELRVVDDLGRPLANAQFELKYDAGQSETGRLDAQGYVKLREIPSGRYALVMAGYDALDYTQVGDKLEAPPKDATHASPKLLTRGVRGTTGALQTIVVHHPKHKLATVEGAGFAFGSSFPGLQVLKALEPMLQLARQNPNAKLMCFGHTDEEGSEDVNKKESDLRASALYALLTSDVGEFDALAEKDKWDLLQYQEMLSALGFRMPVDGKDGPKTEKGVKKFQKAYNEGQFSERDGEGTLKPPSPKLGVDGKPGPKTRAALRQAYLFTYGVGLSKERFFSTPKAGCSEFNLRGSPEADRRVSLGLLDERTAPGSVPCKEGNAGACPVARGESGAGARCKFYSRWFESERVFEAAPLRAPPSMERVLVQTVDELGYALGNQRLTFVDSEGGVTHASTDEDGAFDGRVPVRGGSLTVTAANGASEIAWIEGEGRPFLVDLVLPGVAAYGDEALWSYRDQAQVYGHPSLRDTRADALNLSHLEPSMELTARGSLSEEQS